MNLEEGNEKLLKKPVPNTSYYDFIYEFIVNYINENSHFPLQKTIREELNIGHHSVENNLLKMKQNGILYYINLNGKKVPTIKGMEDKITAEIVDKRVIKHKENQDNLLEYYQSYFNEKGHYPSQIEAVEHFNTNSKNISVWTLELEKDGRLTDFREKQPAKPEKIKPEPTNKEKIYRFVTNYIEQYSKTPDANEISDSLNLDENEVEDILKFLISRKMIKIKLNIDEIEDIKKETQALKEEFDKCFEKMEA